MWTELYVIGNICILSNIGKKSDIHFKLESRTNVKETGPIQRSHVTTIFLKS